MTGSTDSTTRRAVFGGAAAVGAGAVLAACGGGSGGGATNGGDGGTGDEAEVPAGPIGKTSDVPVGGGRVFNEAKIVVTQPTEGEFKAFTAVCTHTGCIVASVQEDTIKCNCHGSTYSAEDGSVTGGPAPSPLAEKKVTVEGGQIVVG